MQTIDHSATGLMPTEAAEPPAPSDPSAAEAPLSDALNTSGTGKNAEIPEGVKGWSWGACLLSAWWAIGNRTWIGLLAFVPYLGWILAIYLGWRGRELAWQNKKWDSVEHFNRVQKKWTVWGLALTAASAVLGVVTGFISTANFAGVA